MKLSLFPRSQSITYSNARLSYPSHQERANVMEQQIVLRQLEAVLAIHNLARLGNHLDALREVAKLPFLPLDPRTPDVSSDILNSLSPHVQSCVPGLLKDALISLDSVTDTDGSLRALRAKVCFSNYFQNYLLL